MTTMAVTREGGWRMSWGAVFGGTVVTLALWLLLHTLGLAAGLTAIDPADQGSLQAIGIGTGVWSVIAPLIALFAGGFVAARTGGLMDRLTGGIHGLVVWGLTTLAGTALVFMALSAVVRGGAAVGSAGAMAAAGAPAGLQAMGLDSETLLQPVNRRLASEGAPPVTAPQLEAAARDAVGRAIRSGEIDREQLVAALATNTRMSREEASAIAQQVESRFQQEAGQLRQAALTAADRAGKAFWAIFLALLLGLISAVAGAVTGSSRRAVMVAQEGPGPGPARRQIPVETHR